MWSTWQGSLKRHRWLLKASICSSTDWSDGMYQNTCSRYRNICTKFVRFVLSLSSPHKLINKWSRVGESPFLSSFFFFYCKLLFSVFLLLLLCCPMYSILGCHKGCLEWLWHWKSQHLEIAPALAQNTMHKNGWSRKKQPVTSDPNCLSTYSLPSSLHPE